MAIQTFVADTILTAAQMNALQGNDYNQTVSTKTASYTLVAADKGTKIVMNSASATTITVNTSLFAAGDTLTILNIAAGVCTVTAGTATVSTTGSLALAQNGGGTLYFTSAGVSVFQATGVTGGGKILQVVGATSSTNVSTSSTSYVTSGLAATITPSLASSKILVFAFTTIFVANINGTGEFTLFRGTVAGTNLATGSAAAFGAVYSRDTTYGPATPIFLDSPNTTSATTYTLGIKAENALNTIRSQPFDRTGQIVLMEVGA